MKISDVKVLVINEEAAGRHPYGGPSEPPHWRRRDGSVQDW